MIEGLVARDPAVDQAVTQKVRGEVQLTNLQSRRGKSELFGPYHKKGRNDHHLNPLIKPISFNLTLANFACVSDPLKCHLV